MWIEPDEGSSPLELVTAAGDRLGLWPGSVEMINPPGCQFDYRVVLGVERDSEGGGRAVVQELTAIRRERGPDLGRRRLNQEPVGWIGARAVAFLTTPPDAPWAEVAISPESAGALLRAAPPSRSTAVERGSELEVAARAYSDAIERGLPVRKHVAGELKKKSASHSDSQVKKLLRECRDAGLIPERKPGRPSRVHRA